MGPSGASATWFTRWRRCSVVRIAELALNAGRIYGDGLLRSSVASTSKPVVASHHGANNGPASADLLVEEADGLLSRVLTGPRGPARAAVKSFLETGALERVLTLYAQAMREHPLASAYPWNLASSLDRLGLSDLALPYMGHAVRGAEAQGDDEFGGPHAHVAWAEIAINADQPELAEVLLKQARALDPSLPVERYERKLRRNRTRPAVGPAAHQDSARKGTAVEHLIAAHCMLASNFELNVSTTLVDDEGV